LARLLYAGGIPVIPGANARVAPFRWTSSSRRSPSTTCVSTFAVLCVTSYTHPHAEVVRVAMEDGLEHLTDAMQDDLAVRE